MDYKTTKEIALKMQEVALNNPCDYKDDDYTVDIKFKQLLVLKELYIKVILTVDIDEGTIKGAGCPVWHCSISYPLMDNSMMPVIHWGEEFRDIAEKVAEFILGEAGVNDKKHISLGTNAFHYRRKLNQEEAVVLLKKRDRL